jgi:hypothetical protein
MYFTINGVDYSYLVSGLRVGYETLVSSNSGRNANGDTVIDVINQKKKVYVTFRHTTGAEMQKLLNAIAGYQVSIGFKNPVTGTLSTISAYTGTPEPEYYTIQSNLVIYKPMNLNFIEL